MGKLTGRIAIITGASRGIGRALVKAFEKEDAVTNGMSRSLGCDVSDERQVEQFFRQHARQHGRLDILINNAGILTPRKPIVDVTTAEWDETMAVNLRGVFLCTRAALRLMIPQQSGLIINVSSGAGKRPAPEWGAYAVSKWSVEGLTQTVAAEVRDSGIVVISVNPGGTRTAMREAAYPQEDPLTLKSAETLAEFFVGLASGLVPVQSGDSIDYPS